MVATARSVNDDLYQNHRFHVVTANGYSQGIEGGFNFVGMPEVNIDMVEYREGLWTYAKKFPVRPHFQPFSLHKGITKNDTSFYRWMLSVNEGKAYRTDVIIRQFHRTDVSTLSNFSNAKSSREWRLYNCFPIRFRSGTDQDTTSADISIQELDLEVEYFRLFVNGQEVTV